MKNVVPLLGLPDFPNWLDSEFANGVIAIGAVVALLLTVVALREAQHQRRQGLLPIVVADGFYEWTSGTLGGSTRRGVRLKNAGPGVAVGLQVEWPQIEELGRGCITVDGPPPPFALSPGDSCDILINVKLTHQTDAAGGISSYDPLPSTTPGLFRASYQDVYDRAGYVRANVRLHQDRSRVTVEVYDQTFRIPGKSHFGALHRTTTPSRLINRPRKLQ